MITVSRDSLNRELTLLSSVLDTKTTLPILASVKVEASGGVATLTASSLDATLETRIECEGEFAACVPLRPLASLVKLFYEDEIALTVKDTRVEVSVGRARHKLPCDPLDAFPQTIKPEGEGVELDGGVLGAMIAATSFWLLEPSDGLATGDWKYTGLSIRSDGKAVEVMASKKVITAVATLDRATPPFKAIVFNRALAAIKSFTGQVRITTSDNHAMFQCGHRSVITRQIVGTFPEWRKFLPELPLHVDLPEGLAKAIQRAEVTADRKPLKVTFTRESMEVESLEGREGKADESLPVTSNLNGESIAIGLFGKQMLEALRGQESVTCRLVAADRPVMFQPTTKDFEVVYIVMPARL